MALGVLLVNLGTPKAPTPKEVRRYLRQFLGDKRVVSLPRVLWWPLLYTLVSTVRARRVARLYQSIWLEEGSPLLVHTRHLAQKLCARGMRAEIGMCYGEPSLESGLFALRAQGAEKIFVLPLYPQYSMTTTAAVFDRLNRILAAEAIVPSYSFLNGYYAEPAYIEAVAGQIEGFWREHGRPQRLLFSFHGLPEKSRLKGDPYYDQCLVSACLIADALGLASSDWQVVFQSRFGPAKWLGPYCAEVLQALPQEGIRQVDVVCPGFAVDCLETLEEIAVANREIFLQSGGEQYRYIPALNDSDEQVAMVTSLVANAFRLN
ncbi:MAG: ferrochelatase [Methylohalobius sp.]|nr:ferrochelatase [Methylohalobius sp.]